MKYSFNFNLNFNFNLKLNFNLNFKLNFNLNFNFKEDRKTEFFQVTERQKETYINYVKVQYQW